MRALTPLELAVAVSLTGTVAATMVPTFLRNVHASRLSEPVEGLKRIAAHATLRAAGLPPVSAYPESAPFTPAITPRGELVLDAPGTWDTPTWRTLDFSFDAPHAYSFAFESSNNDSRSTFIARARGDLDGDGVTSSFAISGSVERGAEPKLQPLEINREVE
ncbi:MAG TPA: hypothetical protein VJV79_35130 [Polyangiaceae bacterium]|nr:hypothetical protein [Polyangiaceae bacterium]